MIVLGISINMQIYYSLQIIKKIAKLNIGYCSSTFRIESQIHTVVWQNNSKRKI